MFKRSLGWMLTGLILAVLCSLAAGEEITGASEHPETLMQWHRVTVTIEGPQASEGGTPNPFMDYRMNVTFEHPGTGTTYVVPGYFAADGDAANTSATSGNKWRAHLCPDHVGTWTYTVSFRQGSNVAVNDSATAGSALTPYDGRNGSFAVTATNKTGRDMRAKGLLEYVGGHFLRFAGNGEYFVKQGADAPENFLAYNDFDGPFQNDGRKDHLVKSWSPHASDWQTGDPLWQGSKGKEIIGAINYLAAEGMNAFSFLPMNIGGDDQNVFPYTSYNERYRMDCSRLDQWEIVFEHGDRMGMFLHFKTQETENELLLDGGNLGNQRKLYYRELIARFSHHPALNWNLGEETNNASTSQKKSWAQYFYDTDPYHHHIVIHNGANHYDLLGPGSKLTGFSLQTNQSDFSNVFSRVKDYIDRSVAAGKPWAVACDEPGDAQHALRPDNDAGHSHEDGRKNALWGTFMAGGWGNEWYFGYAHDHSDLTCQDFRSRDQWWDYCRYALAFFTGSHDTNRKPVPLHNMSNANNRVGGTGNWCLYGQDDAGKPCLVVYTDNGGSFSLDVPAAPLYKVGWMNAKTGNWQYDSDIVSHGGGTLNFTAPNTNDWALLLYDWAAAEPDLVAHYAMEGNVLDSSGYGHNGTLHGGGFVPGQVGQALVLDGADDYVECPTILNPSTGPFSVFTWVKGTADHETIISQYSGSGIGRAWLHVDDDGHLLTALREPGGSPLISTHVWDRENIDWHHVGFVWDGSRRYLYIDGTAQAQDTADINRLESADGGIVIGRNQALGFYWTGMIDDVRIYNYALTEMEINQLLDHTPPTPDPAEFAVVPYGVDDFSIAMAAAAGTDDYAATVEYYFANKTMAGHDSGWQTSAHYTDSGLLPGTPYTYTVKMRDLAGNETEESEPGSAYTTGQVDLDPPTPNPAAFSVAPHRISDTSVSMTAATGADAHGPVEYLFEETTHRPGGTDSDWQTSPVFTDADLSSCTVYAYRVKMRDVLGNVGQVSTPALVGTPCSADMNSDSEVNVSDADMFIAEWLKANCFADNLCNGADLNADGLVDIADFERLATDWLAFFGPTIITKDFTPVEDAYLENGTRHNNAYLKVETDSRSRVSYLKFEVTDIPAGYEVTEATLTLQENGDVGNGMLRFYRGSHNNWTETTLTSGNAPATQDEVGTRSGNVGSGQTISVDVMPLVMGSETYTVIIKMDAGGNDIWFGSSESGNKVPKLTVTAERTGGGSSGPEVWLRLDETGGTTAADAMGHHDGTLVNMEDADWVAGFAGNGLRFDGQDEYVELSSYQGVAGSEARTVTAWIKAAAESKSEVQTIVSWGVAEAGKKWIIFLDETTARLTAAHWGGRISATESLNDNIWHHVAAVIPPGSDEISDVRLYVDGEDVTPVIPPGLAINTAGETNVLVGTTLDSLGEKVGFFNGVLDDVRIYDRALSAQEIAVLGSEGGVGGTTEGTYLESGGLIVMECENTETPQGQWGDWMLRTATLDDGSVGTGGKHLEFMGNSPTNGPAADPLIYRFQAKQTGTYRLHIRGHKRLEGEESDKCNDCYIRMEGNFTSGNPNAALAALQRDTKLYGGSANGWGWASNLDAHDADHTYAAYDFIAGETYTLEVSGRSQRFNIDRIVIHHESVSISHARQTSHDESQRVN